MGKCIVRMTEELLCEFLTQDNVFPSHPGAVLKVKKGIPQGSKLIGITRDHRGASGVASLWFQGPNIPETPLGRELPVYEVVIGEVDMDDTSELVPLAVEA